MSTTTQLKVVISARRTTRFSAIKRFGIELIYCSDLMREPWLGAKLGQPSYAAILARAGHPFRISVLINTEALAFDN
jgi:hypothetical protein